MDDRRANTATVPVVPLLATAALVALQFCREPPRRASAPAIAATSDRYAVAWMRPAKKGGALVVQQFARDTMKSFGPPRAVVEREDLREGGVELVAIEGGYVAISRIEDPEKKPSWATHMLVVPLDGNGKVVGGEQRYQSMDAACHGAGVIGDRVVIAYREVGRSHRHPEDVLGVLAVDRNGAYLGNRVVAYNPIACASAVHGREIAIAWTRWVETKPGEPAAGLRITFEEPRRDGRHETFVVPVGNVDVGPVRIVRHGDGWAILYGDPDEHLHVAFVDTQGRLVGTRALPREVEGDTVDLATNARGLFVTWIDGGRVRVRGIDGSSRELKTAGSRASETRALGDAASCVAAWTVDGGKHTRIATFADCP